MLSIFQDVRLNICYPIWFFRIGFMSLSYVQFVCPVPHWATYIVPSESENTAILGTFIWNLGTRLRLKKISLLANILLPLFGLPGLRKNEQFYFVFFFLFFFFFWFYLFCYFFFSFFFFCFFSFFLIWRGLCVIKINLFGLKKRCRK